MRVVVVGGGVVGLCVAHALARAGATVTVVERGRCGGEASLGNAGWITPLLSAPVPGPGVLRQGLRWMLDPTSPLLVRPRLDRAFLAWTLRFARNCTVARFEAGARALQALNGETLRRFAGLREDGVKFELHRAGLLVVALTEDHLARDWDGVRRLQALGYHGRLELLSAAEAHLIEPVLGRSVAGAILAADEWHVRPDALTSGLVRSLTEAGVAVREGVRVNDLRPSGSGWRIETGAGPVEADRVVIAAGMTSRWLLEGLGTRIPLEGAKGYSVTVRSSGAVPRHALMLQEAKVAVSPFVDAVRFAGTLELGRNTLDVNRRRLGAVIDAVGRYLDGVQVSAEAPWAGLRPLLPDGLPVIGRVPTADGVFVATGHGMLGVTLGPATGEALVPLVLEDRPSPVLEPFAADRSF